MPTRSEMRVPTWERGLLHSVLQESVLLHPSSTKKDGAAQNGDILLKFRAQFDGSGSEDKDKYKAKAKDKDKG